MSDRILIIGANGYIGQNLYNALKGQFSLQTAGRDSNANDIWLDLNSIESLKSLKGNYFDNIIILAADVSALDSENIVSNAFNTNVYGMAHLIDFIATNKLTTRLFYISSMTVYSPHENGKTREEFCTSFPPHSYGFSKRMGELECIYRLQKSNIETIILRIPGIFGASRKSGFVYNLIHSLKSEKEVVIDTKNIAYWDCFYVFDLISIIKKLVLANISHESPIVINVAYGRFCSMKNLAKDISKKLDCNLKLLVKSEQPFFFLDNERIKSLIDFDYTLDKALDDYLLKLDR